MHAHWLLWGGLAACSAAGLAVLARGRWLQSQTLKKSVLLSIGVHAILAVVAAFVGVARPASWGAADEGRMTMQVVPVDEFGDAAASHPSAPCTARSVSSEPPRAAAAAARRPPMRSA